MKIYLIRHFKTEGNKKGNYVGKTDYSICDEELDFSVLDNIPSIKTVYISGLKRTRQTAEKLFPNSSIFVEEGLNEMNFGDFEDKSFIDMAEDECYVSWVNSNCEDICPNGESKNDFIKRVSDRFTTIVKESILNKEETLCFVVHSGTIKAILSHFSVEKLNYFDYNPLYGHGYSAMVYIENEKLLLSHEGVI